MNPPASRFGFTFLEALAALTVTTLIAFSAASSMLALLRAESRLDAIAADEWAVQALLCRQWVETADDSNRIELAGRVWSIVPTTVIAHGINWQRFTQRQENAATIIVELID